MAKDFPKDEFDSVLVAGGRHRARPNFASRLFSFARYAAAVVVLSAAGIAVLNFTSNSSQFTGTVAAINSGSSQSFQDNGLGVTVLDTTAGNGIATKAAQKLFNAGWNVLAAANVPAASIKISTDARTAVYANSATSESGAKKVAKLLGTFPVVVAGNFADPITVVLGADYK